MLGRLHTIAKALLLVGAISVTGAASADQYGNNCCPQDCCWEDCAPAPCCDYGFNPPAHRHCNDSQCCGFRDNLSGHIDFLWWRPNADGLELGTEANTRGFSDLYNTFVDSSGTVETKIKDLDFKFDPGFKLGFGYYSPCCNWDAAVNWTHYHSKAKTEGSAAFKEGDSNNQTLFVSNWDFFGSLEDPYYDYSNYSTTVKGRWTLNLDLVDLDLAKSFYVDQCLILRPYVSLRFSRIHQTYRTETVALPQTDDPISAEGKSTCNFLGIGPRVGLDLDFKLGCGVSVFGKVAGSLSFGKFDRHSEQTQRITGYTNEELLFVRNYEAHGGGNDRRTITMTDIAVGLVWEHCVHCCNKSHPIALLFAWEQHAFYDINNFNFVALGAADLTNGKSMETKHGDLTTQGLTISFMVGF